MINKRRILAMTVACVLAFLLLFSAVYIVHEADHECSGDDCAICAMLTVCESILRQILPAAAAAVLWGAVRSNVFLIRVRIAHFFRKTTPISLKVKLTD